MPESYRQPLLGIFDNREISNIPNPHICSLKENTLCYTFKTTYCPGKWHQGADAVSRNPTHNPSDSTTSTCQNASDTIAYAERINDQLHQKITSHIQALEQQDNNPHPDINTSIYQDQGSPAPATFRFKGVNYTIQSKCFHCSYNLHFSFSKIINNLLLSTIFDQCWKLFLAIHPMKWFGVIFQKVCLPLFCANCVFSLYRMLLFLDHIYLFIRLWTNSYT